MGVTYADLGFADWGGTWFSVQVSKDGKAGTAVPPVNPDRGEGVANDEKTVTSYLLVDSYDFDTATCAVDRTIHGATANQRGGHHHADTHCVSICARAAGPEPPVPHPFRLFHARVHGPHLSCADRCRCNHLSHCTEQDGPGRADLSVVSPGFPRDLRSGVSSDLVDVIMNAPLCGQGASIS